jgi:hypothetical protein
MRYGAKIRESVQALPPLQAERRLRNRLDVRNLNLLDELLADGDPEVLITLRSRLGDYDRILLDRLMESPTAHPRRTEGG